MIVPNIPNFENVVADDIVIDIQGYYTPTSEQEPKLASYVHLEHKYVLYKHPHHKIKRNSRRNQYSWKYVTYAFITL